MFGKNARFENKNPTESFASQVQLVEEIGDLIVMVFTEGGSFTYEPLETRLRELKNANLCDYISKFQNSTELCSVLDNGIAEGGIKQVMLHVKDQLIKIMVPLSKGQISREAVFQSKEWKGLELVFSNLYFKAYQFLFAVIDEALITFFQQEFSKNFSIAIFFMYSFSLISIIFFGLAIKKLLIISRRVVFCYQLLSPEIFQSNTFVRQNFKNIFKSNNS